MSEQGHVGRHVDEQPAHAIQQRRELAGLHLALEFLVPDESVVLELLVVDLRVLLLENVLLVDGVVPALGVLVLDGPHALSFLGVVEEDLVLPLPGLIDDQGLHRGSVNQPLGALALVALAAHVVVVALVAPVVLALVRQVVPDHVVLLVGRLKLLLPLLIHLLYERFLVRDVVGEVVHGDVRDVFEGLVVLLLFVSELEVLHERIEVVEGHREVVYEALDIGLEFVVVFGGDLSLVDGSWTHILYFLSLDCMGSERHDSFGAGRDPLVPATVPAIEVDQHILSVLVHHLPFHPLPRSIADIDPFPDLQLPALKPIGEGVIDEVEVEAFDELVDGVLVLLQHFQRLLLLDPEAVGPLLQLPVLLGLVVLLAVEVGAVDLGALQRGMVRHLRRDLVGHQLDDIPLLNTIVRQ